MSRFIQALTLLSLTSMPLTGCSNVVKPDTKPDGVSDADADADADGDDTGSDPNTGADTDVDGDSGESPDTDEGSPIDIDADGWTEADGDCDDLDDAIHPGADDVCDGIDNDCSGEVDDDAIDATEWYADLDEDGFGNPDSSGWACEQPEGYLAAAGDCDDWNELVHPDADEVCDEIDNDCDDLVDWADDSLTDGIVGYLDGDGDGYGLTATETSFCSLPADHSTIGDDCDDSDSGINPDATEVCDEDDNDCDGLTDEDDPSWMGGTTYYADVDGDGYGDVSTTAEACDTPAGFVTDDNDCDDDDGGVHPAAEDYCGDDVDGNCSGDETDCYEISVNEVHDMIVCDGEARALRASGTRFDISYNVHGLWNDPDTEMGLQIASDGTDWVDVTDPGWAYAVTMYGHTVDPDGDDSWDTYMYSDGGGGELDDLVPDCANAVEVGDVVGVIHEYTLDHTHILKTELWKRDAQIMRVWYEVTNIADTLIGWPAINNFWDPDIDSDVYDETSTTFGITTDDRYLSATGPDSGWTLSVGLCDNIGSVRGYEWPTSAGSTDPSSWEPACDPSGITADLLMGWTGGAYSLDSDDSWEDGFILTTSVGSWAAFEAWATYSTLGPDLCGMDEADWNDDYMTSTVCDSGLSVPDLPDIEL